MIEDILFRHPIASLFAAVVAAKVLLWLIVWPILRTVAIVLGRHGRTSFRAEGRQGSLSSASTPNTH